VLAQRDRLGHRRGHQLAVLGVHDLAQVLLARDAARGGVAAEDLVEGVRDPRLARGRERDLEAAEAAQRLQPRDVLAQALELALALLVQRGRVQQEVRRRPRAEQRGLGAEAGRVGPAPGELAGRDPVRPRRRVRHAGELGQLAAEQALLGRDAQGRVRRAVGVDQQALLRDEVGRGQQVDRRTGRAERLVLGGFEPFGRAGQGESSARADGRASLTSRPRRDA
jgi:hypothetical protein